MNACAAAEEDTPMPAATQQQEPLVRARNVWRRFGRLAAVRDVDLDVGAGEIVGLLGANGAGKTTLIRMLLGLLPESQGTIQLFGEAPSRATRALLGYVPQGLGLWDDLTVAENLRFSAGAFGVPEPAELEPALQAARDTIVRDLPLGLRRRLAFTAALAHRPRLLVLDEPTSGVDPLARARLWDTVHSTAEDGAGVLVTTHYMEEASQCDRLVILAGGAVVAAGTVATIVGRQSVLQIEAADWTAAFAAIDEAGLPVALNGRTLRVAEADEAAARHALAAARVEVTTRLVPARLEEVFVQLVSGEER